VPSMTGSVPMKDGGFFVILSISQLYDCEKVGQIPQMREKPFTLYYLTLGKFGEKSGTKWPLKLTQCNVGRKRKSVSRTSRIRV
jgi:hypothetical protein